MGGYKPDYFSIDLYFNVRMIHQFPSAIWNEHLVQVRRHPGSAGRLLPGQFVLDDLRGVLKEIFTRLGDAATTSDRAAADGWLIYRLIALVAQRYEREPKQTLALARDNLGLLLRNPAAYFYAARLLRNRWLYGDVQQTLSSGDASAQIGEQPLTQRQDSRG